jgi:hypothetical protein
MNFYYYMIPIRLLLLPFDTCQSYINSSRLECSSIESHLLTTLILGGVFLYGKESNR